MIDKIKVNLSYFVYNVLIQDMIKFNFIKPNKDVNRNSFLNTIIVNFYDYKIKKREEIKEKLINEAILTDISSKNKKIMIEAASIIMDDYYNEDLTSQNHEYYFIIYPTKITQSFFDNIYLNEIDNKTTYSSFIRKILNEYAYKPQSVREEISKREIFDLIKLAIKQNNAVTVFSEKEKFKIFPYEIIKNKEETHNYLYGLNLNSKNKSPMTIKLSNINQLIILNENYILQIDEKIHLDNLKETGVEFISKEILKITIELTHGGERMIKFKTNGKPLIKQVYDNIYLVYTTEANFLNYFKSFGKEFKILDNDNLKEKLALFYKEAYENFKN